MATAAGILLMRGVSAVSVPSAAPAQFLALQPIVLAIVLAGVRQALAIPADLRANWTFWMAWDGEVRPYVEGVKRAVIAAIVLPVLIVMFAVHTTILGVAGAAQHTAFGFALSLTAIELLVRPQKLPLTCSAQPPGNLKAFAPVYVLLLFFVAYTLALVEGWALGNGKRFAILVGSALLIYAVARLWRLPASPFHGRMEFDDSPETATQRLGLSEPV